MREKASQEQKATGPLRPYRSILEAEIQQAVVELRRPTVGLVMSGLIAGFGIGTSVFAMGILLTLDGGALLEPGMRILLANAYAVGFVLVILGNTDLFTEYTTIALLPILTGAAPLSQLGRLWGTIYITNLAGGLCFAAILAKLGPAMGMIDAATLTAIARHAVEHSAWTLLFSSILAGWLMGLMSWLVSSTRETVSQIVFVWAIAALIGLGQLHHVIVGGIEIFCGFLAASSVTGGEAIRFLLVVTAGNIAGGFVFALTIRYSVLIRGDEERNR